MTTQPAEPTRVPPDVLDQLDQFLKLLNLADTYRIGLPPDLLEVTKVIPKDRALEQLVAALAVQPAEVRDDIRCCFTWLAQNVGSLRPE